MKYLIGDVLFSIIAVVFLLNNQLTNALVAWCIAELYAVQKKQGANK